MKGRNKKPLAVIAAEGGRIRNDRLNRQAPVPPMGEVISPFPLDAAEDVIWRAILRNAAPGQIRPLDAGLLWRYCTALARLFKAHREYMGWCRSLKCPGESDLLKMGSNLVLGAHPILGVIDKLMEQVGKAESKLGLTPVDREHIKADAQKELFGSDGWAALEVPSDSM